MNHLHTLTTLTGKRSSENRTILIQGFEAKKRTWITLSISAAAGLLVGALLWPFLSYFAALPFALVTGIGFAVLNKRSREGMQLRSYQSFLDRKRSDAGKFYMAGKVIDPFQAEVGMLRRSTVDAPGPSPAVPSEDVEATAAVEDLDVLTAAAVDLDFAPHLSPSLAPEPTRPAPLRDPWATPEPATSGATNRW